MFYKENALKVAEQMDELLESTKVSLEKRVISGEKTHVNIQKVQKLLEQMVSLINREPDK